MALSLSDVVADPDFLALPDQERRKVAMRLDPDFARLSEEDQDVVFGRLAAARATGREPLALSEPVADPVGTFVEGVKGNVRESLPGVPAFAMRTVPTVVGGIVGGVPGALGGAAVGGILAQQYEKGVGLRDEFNFPRLGADMLTSVFPAGRFAGVVSAPARVALRAGQGAVTGGVGGAITNLSEGVPLTDDLIRNVTLGAGIGGTAGLADVTRAQRLNARAIERADDAIALKGPYPEEIPPAPPGVEIPEILRQPTLDIPDFHEGGLTTPRLSTPSQKEAVLAFKVDTAAAADALAKTNAAVKGQRLYLRLAEALMKGTRDGEHIDFEGARLHLPSVMRALDRDGLDQFDFAVQLIQTTRSQGRGLNFLSQVQKELNAQAAKDKSLRAVIDNLSDEPRPTWFGKLGRAAVKFDDFRRAAIVTKLVTTARNFNSLMGTSLVSAVDDAFDATLNGGSVGDMVRGVARVPGAYAGGMARSLGENAADVLKFLRVGNPQSLRSISRVLEKFPEQADELLATPAAEGALGKTARVLNTFNTFTERFGRRAAFDARLRLGLAERGIPVKEALKNPASIPEDLMQEATDFGLRVTYAAKPEGPLGKAVMDAFHNPVVRPLFTTVNPFPRFMVNAYTQLMEHSPAGYLRLMGVSDDPRFFTDPKHAKKTLAKAQTGTLLLSGALAMRNSADPGDKYYEYHGKDLRPFAPLPQMLFMAEAMRQMGRDGELSFTSQDMVQGLLSMNRIAGTGLVAVDLLRSGSMDRKAQIFGDMISSYIGGLTVPFSMFSDTIAAVDPEEGVYRDTRTDAFTSDVGGVPISLAPMVRNIPKALAEPFGLPSSQDLPASRSPIRSGKQRGEAPLFRQFTGIGTKTKNVAESEVDRLAMESSRLLPASGVPELDRVTAMLMAPMVEQAMPVMVNAPGYRQATTKTQRFLFDTMIGKLRKQARRIAVKMRPDLAQEAQLKGLDSELKAVIEEQAQMRGIPLSLP